MKPIFVRTRWHYRSYEDYWRMVGAAGFLTCYVDEVDVETERAYVVCPLNGEWEPMLRARANEGRKRRATLISWTLEPPLKDDYLPNLRRTVDDDLVDWIWIAYRNVAAQAAHPRIVYVPFGSHEGFGSHNGKYQNDVLLLAYISRRRALLVDALRQKGIKVVGDAWGEQKEATLRSSRFLLNVHKEDHFPVYEPIRFAVAAAYGLPIISESCADPHPYEAMVDFYETSYEAAVNVALDALGQPYDPWQRLGQRTRHKMTTEFAFDKIVEEALCRP